MGPEEVVRALLEVAERVGSEERAAFGSMEFRDDRVESEAERIAREHGFDTHRLIALRGLARSRGVDLEVVLRAALRGDLATVVAMGPRTPAEHRGGEN